MMLSRLGAIMSGCYREWMQLRVCAIAIGCYREYMLLQMNTIANGHILNVHFHLYSYIISNGHCLEYTPSQIDTILNGHYPERTPSQMDTISNGHHLECVLTSIWLLLKVFNSCCLVKTFLQR